MNYFKYYKWRIKIFFKDHNFNIFSKFFYENIVDEFTYFFRRFFKDHGMSSEEKWSCDFCIATYSLKCLYWLNKKTYGYPFAAAIKKDGNAVEENDTEYDTEYDDKKSHDNWHEIIHKIRFALFYTTFINADMFSYIIDSKEEREFCYKWAQKKYWYVTDFLTKEFFEKAYNDASLNFEIKTKFIETEDKNLLELDVKTLDKETKKEVNPSFEEKFPLVKMQKELLPQYEEGIKLFAKYFHNLWD